MPLADICEAALTLSDNTAGNLMLESVGGPAGLTQFARSIGDTVSRLDRMETALKEALPGDVRDTTSPRAMAHDIQNFVLGRILSHASKATLIGWMRANKTSDGLRRGTKRLDRWRQDRFRRSWLDKRCGYCLAAHPQAAHRCGLPYQYRCFSGSLQ